jgi:hypothetical protein
MKRSDFDHGNRDFVNNFLSGDLEATPTTGANGASGGIGEGQTGSNRRIGSLGFYLICVRYTFGSDVYIRSSRHRLLYVLFTIYVNEDISLHD